MDTTLDEHALLSQVAGYMATTHIAEYRVADGAAAMFIWIQIGGQTLDGALPWADGSPTPVAGADQLPPELQRQASSRVPGLKGNDLR